MWVFRPWIRVTWPGRHSKCFIVRENVHMEQKNEKRRVEVVYESCYFSEELIKDLTSRRVHCCDQILRIIQGQAGSLFIWTLVKRLLYFSSCVSLKAFFFFLSRHECFRDLSNSNWIKHIKFGAKKRCLINVLTPNNPSGSFSLFYLFMPYCILIPPEWWEEETQTRFLK